MAHFDLSACRMAVRKVSSGKIEVAALEGADRHRDRNAHLGGAHYLGEADRGQIPVSR